MCPAGTWEWIGPPTGDHLWSNPNGTNWKDPTGAVAAANQYPGLVAGDGADFSAPAAGSATLDVNVISLAGLYFDGWTNTLTLNNTLFVTGNTGNFLLNDGSTITIAANKGLGLIDLTGGGGQSYWTSGTIDGGANSSFAVTGTTLSITAPPGGGGTQSLGTEMDIQESVQTQNPGLVILSGMAGNLTLTDASNIIDIKNGGDLLLHQTISTAGQQNTRGGIDRANPNTLAVQVEAGGTLERYDSLGVQGVPDQVKIGGAVYNLGGTVKVDLGSSMLNLTGKDINGYSYWQKTANTAALQIASGCNIAATGSYQIDIGTVQLTTGGNSRDRLDGAGLNFGNDNATALTIVDAIANTPGTVTVQGPVTLAAKTTTTMNFNGTNNTADLLDVQNGALTLNGQLKLKSGGTGKPTQALNFFDDGANMPSITDAGIAITDDAGGMNDSGKVVPGNQNLKYYQVTIT